MSEALPRIGWIEHSRRARGVRVAGRRDAVSPRVSAAELDRLAMLLGDARCSANAAECAPTQSRLRYLRSYLRPAKATKSIAALLALAATTAVISQFATKTSHDLASNGSLAARGIPAAFDSSRSRGDGAMRGSVVAGVLSAGLVAGSALAQDAVQWRVEDGGNGHWYGGVTNQSGWTWTIALQTAPSLGGQLVSCETAGELQFVIQRFSATHAPSLWQVQSINPAAKMGPWIGALQAKGAIEPNGGWTWLTGVSFDPQDNLNCCGDDCSGVQEDRLHLYAQQSTGWTVALNDLTDDPSACSAPLRGAVIEWSADCNSDGIVDFGQIRAGELEDTNANNIPDCCEQGVTCNCPADIDGSGAVNAIDLAIVIGYWGTDGGKDYPQADIDRSGEIDGADLATLLGSWGPCE